MKHIRLVYKIKALLYITIACLKSIDFINASAQIYRSWIEWWIQQSDVTITLNSITVEVGSYSNCLFLKILHSLFLIIKKAGTRAIYQIGQIIIPENLIICQVMRGRGFVVHINRSGRKLNYYGIIKRSYSTYTKNFKTIVDSNQAGYGKYHNRFKIFRGLSVNQKVRGLFKLLEDNDLWLTVFKKLAIMTKSNIVKGTIDSTSLKFIIMLKSEVISGSYRFKSDVNFDIKNALVLGVVQEILEVVFELFFCDQNSSFKSDLKQLHAINYIHKNFRSVDFWVEGNIRSSIVNIDHSLLLNALKKRIDDKKFIYLIMNYLQYTTTSTFFEKNCTFNLFLLNIYFDYLDKFVINLNVNYCRYNHDIILGFCGDKVGVNLLCKRIRKFIDNEIKFESIKLNLKLGVKGVIFLNYLISYSKFNNKGYIKLAIPKTKFIHKLYEYGFCDHKGESVPCMQWYFMPRLYINIISNVFFKNIWNYYKLAFNVKPFLVYIIYIMRNSVAKMFAARFKLKTRAKVFKKFGRGLNLGAQEIIPYFGYKQFNNIKNQTFLFVQDVFLILEWNGFKKVKHINCIFCVICNFEIIIKDFRNFKSIIPLCKKHHLEIYGVRNSERV